MTDMEKDIQSRVDKAVNDAKTAWQGATVKVEAQVQSTWKRIWPWVALAFAALAIASLLANHFWPKQTAPTTYTAAAPIPAAANVPTQEIPAQRVVVLVKQEAIKKLPDLPPEIKLDPKAQITTTADIKPSPYGGSAVAFINTSTGRSSIVYKAKEMSLLGFPSDMTVGVRYGVTTRTPGQEGQVYAKWDLVRVGSAYLGIYGEANSRPEAKGMVDLSMRF